MPESRWRAHSVRNPNPSFPTVTCPEYPPSKYFPIASAIRALTRARNASPTSMFFPEIRKGTTPFPVLGGPACAAELKFLQPLQGARVGTSNRKAAREVHTCQCPFAFEVRVRGCRDGSRTSQAGRWSTRRRGRIVDPNRPDFNRGRRLDASSRRRPVPTAFLAAAAPTKGYASPLGTLRPSGARYRPPTGAAFPRSYRPTARPSDPRPRSAA